MGNGWKKLIRKMVAVLCAFACVFVTVTPKLTAKAAGGTVYTCTINRCYAHPVTGVIEDAGGEASYATGQGMVEGCVYATGMMEVTDSGEYYLTIRMSLMDYTSGHSFWVQNVGDSDWQSPALGQTGSGTDTNGTTADITICVPSENCVVRGSMYVEPMGRDVVFYLYPSDYSAGNTTDMTPTIVTESSAGAGSAASTTGAATGMGSTAVTTGAATDTESTTAAADTTESTTTAAGTTESTEAEAEEATGSTEAADSQTALSSSITQAAGVSNAESDEINKAEGLSLSTADDTDKDAADSSQTAGNKVFQIAAAVLIDGFLLIGAVAAVVYFFRRNWRRWGGEEDDE